MTTEVANKTDVIEDVRPYLILLTQTDCEEVRNIIKQMKLEHDEAMYGKDDENEDADEKVVREPKPPTIAMIRDRIVHYKLEKICGAYENLKDD